MGTPVNKWAALKDLSATPGAAQQTYGFSIPLLFLPALGLGLFALFYLGPQRDPWVLLAYVGTAVSALLSSHGYRVLRRKQLVANVPTSKCRSIAMGFVEVAGKAVGELTTPSLIVQVPCYCSEIRVWRYAETEKKSGWSLADMGFKAVNFYVEDDTGRVRVNPIGAQFDLTLDYEYDTSEGAQRRLIHDSFHSYCVARGIGWGGQMRFEEHNLRPGRPVYVLGTASELHGAQDEKDRVIIRKGKHHPWFFIAESSQRDVLQKLVRNTGIYTLGGMTLTLICLVWFLSRF